MPRPHSHVIPNAARVTRIPVCRCGKPAYGVDLTIGQPVCSDHFVDWLESTRTEVAR